MPDLEDTTLIAFQAKRQTQQEMNELLMSMKGMDDVTLDCQRLAVYCSINSPDDAAAARANDGQGIGLYRSEFMYLAASDYPSEDD